MDGWSVTQYMIVKKKIKYSPVNAGHYMAFKHHISYATSLAAVCLQTLAAIHSESCQTSFPGFCVPPFEVAVLFNSNLSTRPFLRQVVYLDLVLSTGFYNFYSEHAVLFLFHQRPMNDQKIEQSNQCCFGR